MECEADQPTPHRLSATVLWLAGRVSLRARQLMNDRLLTQGVRKAHYGVLATLAEYGPATQAQIGRRIGVDRSDMVAVLNDLADEGYLTRAPDPADRRRNIVALTDAGRAALRRFDRLVVAADDTLLDPLSPAERAQLVTLLERVLNAPGKQ